MISILGRETIYMDLSNGVVIVIMIFLLRLKVVRLQFMNERGKKHF